MKFHVPQGGQINWVTSIFLIATLIVALVGVPIFLVNFAFDWFYFAVFFFFFCACGFSITVGYHRLLSHKAYKAGKTIRFLTLLFGAGAFQNSALDWSSDHRIHHKFVDEDEDPYDINKGFFWAHIGWLFFKQPKVDYKNVVDLKKDKMVMFQHNFVQWIGFTVAFGFPAVLGWFWNGLEGLLGCLLFGGVVRIVALHHFTFFINSLCHTLGSRPYCGKTSARDSGITALFTFGEGYHNFHHTFQHDYRNGLKPWAFDPSKWIIWTCSKIGLASDLRRVSDEKILLAEMKEARRQAEIELERIEANKDAECPTWSKAVEKMQDLSQSMTQSYSQLEDAVSERVSVSKDALQRWREETAGMLAHVAVMSRLEPAAA